MECSVEHDNVKRYMLNRPLVTIIPVHYHWKNFIASILHALQSSDSRKLPMDSAIVRVLRLSIPICCNFFLTEKLIYGYVYVYIFMYSTKSTIEILVTKTTYVAFFSLFLLQAGNLNQYYKKWFLYVDYCRMKIDRFYKNFCHQTEQL